MHPQCLKLFIAMTIGCFGFCTQNHSMAEGKASIAREVVETAWKKFGSQATQEAGETFARKADDAILRYGDDAVEAIRKVGPRSLELIQQAGSHAPDAIRLMARHGDDAIWVVSQPKRMAIFIKHGDDAAQAMIRHREFVEPLLQSLGNPGARALANVNSQNARRIAMMIQDADLAKIGRTPEVLSVIERFGDRAMELIWKHKVVLTGGVVLAAFLNDPEPFIDGTQHVATAGIRSVGAPLAEQAAQQISWATLSISAIACALLAAWRLVPRRAAVVVATHPTTENRVIHL
jgi:hypothetical protein